MKNTTEPVSLLRTKNETKFWPHSAPTKISVEWQILRKINLLVKLHRTEFKNSGNNHFVIGLTRSNRLSFLRLKSKGQFLLSLIFTFVISKLSILSQGSWTYSYWCSNLNLTRLDYFFRAKELIYKLITGSLNQDSVTPFQ